MITNALKTLASIIFIFLLAGCANQTNGPENEQKNSTGHSTLDEATVYINLNDSVKNALIKKGNIIAQKSGLSLQKALKEAINEGGLEYAIEFCNIEALPITDSVSHAESVIIRRVAKKYRNPLNQTDSVDIEIYNSYMQDWQNGKPSMPMIKADENNHPVYYNPIYVGALCLNCHGEVGTNINPGLAGKIKELYPEDMATDFKLDQLRGMWAITFYDIEVK